MLEDYTTANLKSKEQNTKNFGLFFRFFYGFTIKGLCLLYFALVKHNFAKLFSIKYLKIIYMMI